MTDFIAKKREIFLVQMSLDTKRAEITKLEERALQVQRLLCPVFVVPTDFFLDSHQHLKLVQGW